MNKPPRPTREQTAAWLVQAAKDVLAAPDTPPIVEMKGAHYAEMQSAIEAMSVRLTVIRGLVIAVNGSRPPCSIPQCHNRAYARFTTSCRVAPKDRFFCVHHTNNVEKYTVIPLAAEWEKLLNAILVMS